MVPLWRTAGSPIMAGEFGQRRNRFADDRRRRDGGVLGSGADHQRTALHLDFVETFDVGEIDQMRRAGEPLLHDRHQRVAAGDHLGVFVLHQEIGGLPHGRRAMIFEFVHENFLIAVAMNSIKRTGSSEIGLYARSDLAIALAPAAIDCTMF